MFTFELEEPAQVTSHTILVEKYRPKNLDELICSSEMRNTLKSWIDKQEVPHILLYSAPGTGKTSIAKILINHIQCDSLIINASDENSVDDIRNKVQDFAMTMGIQPLKIIFLDEADRMTPEAQGALRNIMETYTKSTRFIFTANHQEKITAAIKSRCQSYEVAPPSKVDVMKHLVKILSFEKILYKNEDLAFIVGSYFPDIRKIINFTQQSSIDGELKIQKADSADHDYKVKLVELLKQSKKTNNFNEIRQLVADASFSNYEEVYKYLFSSVDTYALENAPEVILHLAEAVYQSSLVFEREITFIAAIHKIITAIRK